MGATVVSPSLVHCSDVSLQICLVGGRINAPLVGAHVFARSLVHCFDVYPQTGPVGGRISALLVVAGMIARMHRHNVCLKVVHAGVRISAPLVRATVVSPSLVHCCNMSHNVALAGGRISAPLKGTCVEPWSGPPIGRIRFGVSVVGISLGCCLTCLHCID
jgi:hypothetical protein